MPHPRVTWTEEMQSLAREDDGVASRGLIMDFEDPPVLGPQRLKGWKYKMAIAGLALCALALAGLVTRQKSSLHSTESASAVEELTYVACPAGYVRGSGNIPGAGIFGHGPSLNAASAAACAHLCALHAGCMSFEFSPSARKCNINRQCKAKLKSFGDYTWCAKPCPVYHPPPPPCAAGYVLIPKGHGPVKGSGMLGNQNLPSSAECGRYCAANPHCLSYEFSVSTKKCIWSKSRLQVPGSWTRPTFHMCRKGIPPVKACPAGWIMKTGFHHGVDAYSADGHFYEGTIALCAQSCAKQEGCMSIQYSAARGLCYRFKVTQPEPSEKPYSDFHFCARKAAPAPAPPPPKKCLSHGDPHYHSFPDFKKEWEFMGVGEFTWLDSPQDDIKINTFHCPWVKKYLGASSQVAVGARIGGHKVELVNGKMKLDGKEVTGSATASDKLSIKVLGADEVAKYHNHAMADTNYNLEIKGSKGKPLFKIRKVPFPEEWLPSGYLFNFVIEDFPGESVATSSGLCTIADASDGSKFGGCDVKESLFSEESLTWLHHTCFGVTEVACKDFKPVTSAEEACKKNGHDMATAKQKCKDVPEMTRSGCVFDYCTSALEQVVASAASAAALVPTHEASGKYARDVSEPLHLAIEEIEALLQDLKEVDGSKLTDIGLTKVDAAEAKMAKAVAHLKDISSDGIPESMCPKD